MREKKRLKVSSEASMTDVDATGWSNEFILFQSDLDYYIVDVRLWFEKNSYLPYIFTLKPCALPI